MSQKRGKACQKAIKEAKKRDYYTCQICGSSENVTGHHIWDRSFNGADHEDNIVTLCKSCHDKVHKGLIDIDTF